MVEKSKEGDGDFPWMSCVMGCRPPEDKEVILLKCLHVICSPTCTDNWKKQLNSKEGALPYCTLCRMQVKQEDLKEKVIYKKVFSPKLRKDEVKLICEWCIHDKPATTYCPSCPLYLCEDCTNSHSRLQRHTLDHKLDENLDQRREIEFQFMLQKKNQCKVDGHAASPITKYCITCQQKLCAQCQDHDASHKILDTQKGKELFIANLEAFKELYKKFEESIEKTQSKRTEFSLQKFEAISFKISEDFAQIRLKFVETLKKYEELTIEEERKAFDRRRTDLYDLETKEFMKNNIAQMCNAYESVQKNLDEAAQYYFSHRASESTEFVNVFAEILKDGDVDMVEDSNEFSQYPKFIKSVLSHLENGPAKFQYGVDLKNNDETASVSSTLLDANTQAQDTGGCATLEKDIIVTSVFSLNASASSPSQGIAQKSTGHGDCRYLGMPHLKRCNRNQATPKPATSSSLEPFTIVIDSNRKPASPQTSTTSLVPSTSGITSIPSASAATSMSNSQSSDVLSAESFQTTAFQMHMTTKQKRDQNLNNVSSQPRSTITVTASEGKVDMEDGPHASTETVSKKKSSKGKTADKIEVDSPSKSIGVEVPNVARENGGKDSCTVTVQSSGISLNETSLSDSCDNEATVRVGLRNRKEKIYTDFVDPTKDIMFSKEENMLQDKIVDLSASPSRKQSLRNRGNSSASRPSTPAVGKLANDKKRGEGVRTGKMKRTSKRLTNDDCVSDNSGPDKRRKNFSEERKYKCQICSKAFVAKCNLIQHEITHTGVKPFHCSFCKKKYTRNCSLKRHTCIHTGERNYPCPICGTRFLYSQQLNEHMSVHRHNPISKAFICMICRKVCTSASNMKAHVKRFHKK